jgi:predicted lipoprotein with Yx(FWY)xxD motif
MNTRILGVAAAFGLALAACSSSSSSKVTTPPASSPTSAAAAPTTAAASSASTSASSGSGGGYYGSSGSPTTAAAAGGGAQISLSSGHLAAPDGHTVYFLDRDKGTTSACTGACAAVWPAVTSAAPPTAGTGVDASKLATATGQAPNQVTYNGHLLYEFKGDTAAGQTNGTKIPGWHDVNAAGTAAS